MKNNEEVKEKLRVRSMVLVPNYWTTRGLLL